MSQASAPSATRATGHVFIATSLDGYIARPDGAIDWLVAAAPPGEDHGYDSFVAGMDAIVMGRGTYETVSAFDAWPYRIPAIVLSRSLGQADLPARLLGHVEIASEAPAALVDRLAGRGWRRLYVDGGAVIRAFLAEGLIEDMVLTVLPVLLGAGRPLFGALPGDVAWNHVATRAFPSGLVQSHYRIRREAEAA